MELSVIVVNTNQRDRLRSCLQALERARLPQPHEIIVVDNASLDGSADMVATEFPSVHLVPREERAGPAANYNVGFERARGRYLVVLNEDAEVTEDALAILYDYLEAHPEVAVAGPRLLYPDGRPQWCCHRFPGLASVVKRLILQAYFDNAWVQDQLPEERRLERCDPDWIMATSLMIRREALDSVGRYDEGFVVYYEEVDLCRRLRGRGWRVSWLPEAVVYHHHGVSQFRLRREWDVMLRELLYRSRYYYFRKHHGSLFAGAVRLAEGMLFAVYAAKAGCEALVPLYREQAWWKRRLYLRLAGVALAGKGCRTLPPVVRPLPTQPTAQPQALPQSLQP